MIDRFLGDAFRVVSCQFRSIVLQSGARLPIHTLNYWTEQKRTEHPLNSALPGPYVPVRVTHGALVAPRYTSSPPRCRTLQYSRTFIPFSVSLWNDLANPVFDGVELAGFKSRANASLLA